MIRGAPTARLEAFSRLAEAGADDPAVMGALRRAGALSSRRSARERAAAALRITQRLPYDHDAPGVADVVTSPCETLAVGGDCEDLSALLVSLWAAAGLRGRLVWLTQGESSQDHVSAQVWIDGRWWWGESTVAGARLGEDPYDAAARLGIRGQGGAL